ncbi:MAG: two-component system LytT family sensor kinase [Saprospiraceae bacterium]|jgi:two-component system LytT family sensor kinase
MTGKLNTTTITSKEVVFQLVLHLLVFSFFSFDKNHPQIEFSQVIFFLNYACAVFIINYFLLPRFFYQKKYLQFFTYVLLVIAGVILIEELVIERIYFPDTKGKHFPGVFFSLLDVLPVITILSGFKFAWDALGKQREVDELKATIKESELQFLKSQINPHFLFNNLNNLYSYAIENSPKTPEIILELSGVLRYMLYECKEQYVSFAKEVEQLENFINLNEMQIEERGEVHFLAQNIQTGFQIAPLILIVFIENAFKHSTASQTDKIKIDVDLKLSDAGILNFVCKNSFQELSNTDNLSHGIGLENVKKRLQLIYPGAYQLDIEKSKTYYEVQLSIDLNKTA